MRLLILVSILALTTPAFAEKVTIHLWQGGSYTDVEGEADWNDKVKAYVVSSAEMTRLKSKHSTADLWANGAGWLGAIASVTRWHYRVVSGEEASKAVEEGRVFAPMDAGAKKLEPAGALSAAEGAGAIESIRIAPNQILHAGPSYGPGEFLYKDGVRQEITIEDGRRFIRGTQILVLIAGR